MFEVVKILASSAILSLTIANHPAVEQASERSAKKLSWAIETHRSIEVRLRTEVLMHTPQQGPGKSNIDAYTNHYIETAAGQRFNEYQGLNRDKVASRNQDYGDGTRFAHVEFLREQPRVQGTVAIMRRYWLEDQHERKNLPAPLRNLYVGNIPLQKALGKAEYAGESKVIGRNCDAFLFRAVKWNAPQDQVYFLDHETATPLKIEAYRDEAARANAQPLWVWTADSFERPGDYPVVLKSTTIAYSNNSPNTPDLTWHEHIESIEFDKSYPDSTFWPVIEPTASVFDSFTNKVQNGTLASKRTPRTTDANSPTQATIASPPTSAINYLPFLLIVVGFVAFATAGFVWLAKSRVRRG